MSITSVEDMDIAIKLFTTESDKWLKKIIASKILENSEAFDVSQYESDLQEAIKCQIK